MQFFNFWNAETFHFFQWLTESGQVPVEVMVQRAIVGFEQLDLPVGECLDRSEVWDLLTAHLQDVLEGLADPVLDASFVDDLGIGGVDDSEDSLWKPLLAQALRNVDCRVVAEALLTRHAELLAVPSPTAGAV